MTSSADPSTRWRSLRKRVGRCRGRLSIGVTKATLPTAVRLFFHPLMQAWDVPQRAITARCGRPMSGLRGQFREFLKPTNSLILLVHRKSFELLRPLIVGASWNCALLTYDQRTEQRDSLFKTLKSLAQDWCSTRVTGACPAAERLGLSNAALMPAVAAVHIPSLNIESRAGTHIFQCLCSA